MGCWNKTCGLSSLHITHGTPVYVFVLEKGKEDSNCYSTSLFTPLLLPFESEYNDYGGGENSSGPAFDLIMLYVKKYLVELEVGENQYHDIAVNKEDFNEQMFFDAVHETRLSIQFPHRKESTPISFTMFRKDIVDDILENRVMEEYVGGNKGTIAKWGDEKNYIQYKFVDILSAIRPMIDDAMRILGECDEDNRAFKLVGGFEYMFDHDYDNLAYKWLRGDSYRYSRIVDMKRVISRAFQIGTLEAMNKLEIILKEYFKGIFIDSFMHSARKTWIPGGHEGSQDTSGGALRQLWNATAKVLDEEKRQWMEDMGEDEAVYEE